MEALRLSTERVRAAMKLASVLLLAAYASAPAAAHDTASVDKRSMAQAAADEQKRELEEMRLLNVDARRNAEHLQRQILGLQPEVIDRGLLLTLDDAVFAGNDATLSERRSMAVASSLIQRGIATARLSARVAGRTEQASSAVAYDCDAQSLHQNRRVLVTIENALTSAGQP